MNRGKSQPKTTASAAVTSAGLSKRLHSGRGTGAADLAFTARSALPWHSWTASTLFAPW
jgi:hypothetical protein